MMQRELVLALKRYPVFTVRDIASVLDKKIGYAYLAAYRLKKAGVILEIEKGKYTLEEDPFIVCSWIVWPSYISVWAALSYYKLTEQLPFTLHVVTTRKRKKKTLFFGNAKIEFIKVRESAFFGFKRVIFQGREIFVAEKEKAIVDGLAAKKMTLPEALEIIKNNKGKLSRRKIFSYAKTVMGLAKKLKEGLRD